MSRGLLAAFGDNSTKLAMASTQAGSMSQSWTEYLNAIIEIGRQMASVHWNLVIDYDTETDILGNYAKAKKAFEKRHALRLTALDSMPEITTSCTLWVAASGLQSMPTTQPTNSSRDWNRSKIPQLEQIMNELARITEPTAVTLIIFGGETEYVSMTCDVADRAFTERIALVIATQSPRSYLRIEEKFSATTVHISLPDVCQGLRESRPSAEPTIETILPKLGGGTVALDATRVRWVEEQFELLPWDASTDAFNEKEEQFLKGSVISWTALSTRSDVDRRITNRLQSHIRRELEARGTRRVNLWYRPGAGATTVARRIAWDLHREFPTVFVREHPDQGTVDRLQYVFRQTHMPILTVIDLPGVTQEIVNRFYTNLRRLNIPAVLFDVERRSDSNHSHYLDAMLQSEEAFNLFEKLATRVPERRDALKVLVNQNDPRRKTAFYFGLEAYGRDFQRIESYVQARLSNVPSSVRKAMHFISFAYYYGKISLPLQTLTPIFNLTASTRFTLSGSFPDDARELLVEEDTSVRPAHQLIAEEILQQELCITGTDRRNWRTGLADLATKFIDLVANVPHRQRGPISDILKSVLIERDTGESPAGPWTGGDAQFSQFLRDVPSQDGQQRVLSHLTAVFPEEPHFWAHLGRFYNLKLRNHQKAHEAHEKALDLLPDDSLLHHMAGMGWRAELYDLLAKHGDFSSDNEEEAFELLNEAKREFEAARNLNSGSEHNYISQIQMLLRTVTTIGNIKGYRDQIMEFLSLRGNDRYRELIDEAQNLLSDLQLVKGSEAPSQLQEGLQADLERLYGDYSKAIERLTNVLDHPASFKPPLRRAIIRSYVSKRQGDWGNLTKRELDRVAQLARENLDEEPSSDYNLRLWLRAVRTRKFTSCGCHCRETRIQADTES